MSEFTEAVERGLKGLTAVSTGICSGCDTCRTSRGVFGVEEDEDGFFVPDRPGKAVYFQDEEKAEAEARALFDEAVSSGDCFDEGSFSHGSCGICNSHLGGTRFDWHAIVPDEGGSVVGGEILHFDDACTDCVMYLANGDEPEDWEG